MHPNKLRVLHPPRLLTKVHVVEMARFELACSCPSLPYLGLLPTAIFLKCYADIFTTSYILYPLWRLLPRLRYVTGILYE